MNFGFNRYFYLSETTEGDTGSADVPLGEKGQKALEAEKAKARELAKKAKELEDRLKAFEGMDLNAVQEAIEFQRTAKLEQAEKEKNTEEARSFNP